MNLSKLISNKGKRLRLRPEPVVWTYGGDSSAVDDNWVVADASARCVHLVNERTGQQVHLSPDHVHNYLSSPPDSESFDGFLELKVTIDLTRNEPRIDLIPSGAARTLPQKQGPPLRARLEALLDRINPEILRVASSGVTVVHVMVGDYNLHLLNDLRRQPGFGDLVSVHASGNMCIGTGNRIGGHIHDLDDSGTLHGFVLEFKGVLRS